MADDLQSSLGEYRSSREELERRREEADATRLATNQAIEACDRAFPWIASSLESNFRLVGERELADRIRTSVRRVTRRQAAEGAEPQEPSPDPAADVPDSASSEATASASSEAPESASSEATTSAAAAADS